MGQGNSKSKITKNGNINQKIKPKKEPENITIKLFKKCEMWENLVLFFFFTNLILIWVFVTFYLLLGYIQFDFSS
jgi:hypothetical protein